jgi:uncharacterized protein YjbI with pentapeptide repeats
MKKINQEEFNKLYAEHLNTNSNNPLELSNYDFTDCYGVYNCKLNNCKVYNCGLNNCNLNNCNVYYCGVAHCELTDCELTDCELTDCELTDCKLTDCELTDCKFDNNCEIPSKCEISGCELCNHNEVKSKFHGYFDYEGEDIYMKNILNNTVPKDHFTDYLLKDYPSLCLYHIKVLIIKFLNIFKKELS